MIDVGPLQYDNVCTPIDSTPHVFNDHMGGFSTNNQNQLLDLLNRHQLDTALDVYSEYIFDSTIKEKYNKLNLKFSLPTHVKFGNLDAFYEYTQHPPVNITNFICSFNGSGHVGRKLLVSIIKKFGWYNIDYISKNFSFTGPALDGHIRDFVGDDEIFYRKFFTLDDPEFCASINNFKYTRYNHLHNIGILSTKIAKSFLNIVSETMSTSNYPFYGEKFLYSVVNRGLFLANGQPGWHKNLEKYYGFKLYTKIFDYRFDSILNPVERLLELITMISKFSMLSTADWSDLYLLEQETIEYNYDHYFSGNYLIKLKQTT
jgi:hypothetical protein